MDTASYTQARRQIMSNQVPAAASVRTEEFVNFFRYDYPEPEAGRPFSITMDGASHPWRGGHHLLRVGIKGAEQHERARRPVHLTFLVDVSGSMHGTPMEAAIALGILVSELSHAAFRHRAHTFESRPNWVDLSGCVKIADKVRCLQKAPWGGSTNL